MNQLFDVVVSCNNISGFAILEHKGRTSWTKRTALKHARDVKKSGKYLFVGITPSYYNVPVEVVEV